MAKTNRNTPPAEIPAPGLHPEGQPDADPGPLTAPIPDKPAAPAVKPDFDPDLPEHPGPPLTDPETPRS